MDRSLDEIVAENQQQKRNPRRRGGNGGNGGGRPRERDSYPRDGSTRDDSRNMDSEWVHDKFEDSHSHGRSRNSRRRNSPGPSSHNETRGTKIKVENVHYDLSQGDLNGLFSKIGPLVKVELVYDRAGRSEGIAFVTYEEYQDAKEAVREFDGANAKGQPIRLSIMPSGPRRNPFDTAQMPGRSLADRITVPSGRSRSYSPGGDRGIDRYIPAGGRRSRSPLPRRRGGGRRPGQQREGGGRGGAARDGERKGREGREGRPKKTQDELDAEMADYFGATSEAPAAAEPAAAAQAGGDDIDMIE
ncbi:hypothetical protein JX265_006236 [Neoarthrinium moseri]|uniref:RRM domain-containing protein n=1 Tax=Neoarthrinium moseri TaxID=1658444 RepID=A0A9Q0APJ8_9PEZI|nr:hypothetical protein JX266_010407 [Neoarthrinium moseri]KAI1870066.1 hypothetical protein JX265_006236 [Neoarthrinium moseri]